MIKRVDDNGQVHLVTNIRKPRKWRRYEYLEGSGTLWIDTGYAYTSEITETYCKYNIASNQEKDLFGCSYKNKRWITLYNDMAYVANASAVSLEHTLNQINEVTFKTGENGTPLNIVCNGVVKDSRNKTTSVIFGANMAIFTMLDAVNTTLHQSRIYSGKIYHFSMKQDGVLVRDMVPCSYNGLYGMWDLVEDRFYGNSGTGEFTVGPEIKNYDEIYEVRKTSSFLPAGVELYDYLQGDGSSYIDSSLPMNRNTTIDYTMSMQAKINLQRMIGHMVAGLLTLLMYIGDSGKNIKTYSKLNASGTYTVFIAYNTNIHRYLLNEYGTHKFYMDGVAKGTYTSLPSDNTYYGNCYLFWANGAADGQQTKCRIYECKLYDEGVLRRNFLPCTYLGEPGMWDTVENKFYRNSGAGQFILGNKITLKEYEYLLGDGEACIDSGFPGNINGNLYKIGFKATAFNGSNCNGIIGTHNPSAPYDRSYLGYITGSKWEFGAYDYLRETGFLLNTYYDIELNNTNNRYIVKTNNTIIKDVTHTLDKATANILVGAVYSTNGNYSYKGMIYYAQIYDNNQLVRDFIPVSYNETPGLWDKVEWKFYENAGSGSFTLGPEKTSGIYPVSYLYDRAVYEEPDGSKWLRIAHHDNPNTRRFTSSDSFTTYVHTDEHLFFDVSWCNTFTRWELMVKQKTTSEVAELKFRWVLNYNPMTATYANVSRANVTYNTSPDYTTPIAKLGGLYHRLNYYSYLICNNGSKKLWFGNVGGWTVYDNGMPGWNNTIVTTGYLDLYIRIT